MVRIGSLRCGLSLFALSLTVAGCQSTQPTPGQSLLSTLRAAPTSASFGGQTLVITASLNRDFQPGGLPPPPNWSALFGVANLQTTDLAPISNSTTVDAVWAIYGQEIWTATPDSLFRTSKLQIVVRDGPKWPVGAAVDVVVRATGPSGTQLIRVANVVITSSS